MTSNFLLLNSDKTEILLIVPKNSTQNLLDYNLQLDVCPVPSSTVKNLGVILDSNLSFENHISNITKTAFFHLRNIAKLRNMLSVSDAEKLVHAFMTSRLDYCNALLGGCPASSINKLQIVQNAAARVLTRSRKYDHTPILQSLHWLPIIKLQVIFVDYFFIFIFYFSFELNISRQFMIFTLMLFIGEEYDCPNKNYVNACYKCNFKIHEWQVSINK